MQFGPPNNVANAFANQEQAFLAAPTACTVRSLTVNAITTASGSPIEADTTTFTVIKNESPTSMTCQIPVTGATASNTPISCSSTSAFTVVQGDRISLQFAETISDAAFGFVNFGTTLVCQ
jgi:hypothetical protein